jgi:hypothetical protein
MIPGEPPVRAAGGLAKTGLEPALMSNNNFKPRKFEDFEIVDPDGLVVGHIRVKPSGVLWARANSKVWHGVGLKRFAQFMEARGRKQKK